MKILFIILAHNEPDHVARLAVALTGAASDAHAIIHFDGNSDQTEFASLSSAVLETERLSLVRDRVRCQWGDYSLVDAVLRSLRQVKVDGIDFDYAVLLSGACLPCRPIRQLERFLEENSGQEFIESVGPEWMIDGLRKERYVYWSPFPPKPNGRDWSRTLRKLQSRLGIKRTPPAHLEIRFGSQWWALSRDCCESILELLESNPAIERFFRTTYIPDEMMFQTLVHHIAEPERIAGFNLTHYHFTNRGKAVVFYDDHGNYPLRLDKFFFRKVSGEAKQLREACLARAFDADDASDLSNIDMENRDYGIKVSAQTNRPRPGQLFYRDQYVDQGPRVLRTLDRAYVLIVARDMEQTQAIAAIIECLDMSVIGRCFGSEEIDFRGFGRTFKGLNRDHIEIRKMHPELYLCRIVDRLPKTPVFYWCLGDDERLLDSVRRDQKALVVSLIADEDLIGHILPRSAYNAATQRLHALSIEPEHLIRIERSKIDWCLRGLTTSFALEEQGDWRESERVIHLPLHPDRYELDDLNQLGKLLQTEIDNCAFRLEPWFQNLASELKNLISKDAGNSAA